MTKLNRILMTGAAGGIGTAMRDRIGHLANIIRLSDRETPDGAYGATPVGEARENEEVMLGDVSDFDFCLELTKDVDQIFHWGGKSIEGTWDIIRDSNIDGHYKLYEAARQNGVKRIVWGSSNHAVGMYDQTEVIDSSAPPRPDSNYGVSKAFGEALGQYYWDKYGLETLTIRIGSCFKKPMNERMCATWISFDDMARLLECSVKAPSVQHSVIYGISNNTRRFWDNSLAAHIGYRPQDNGEVFREQIVAEQGPLGWDEGNRRKHGGNFATAGHFEFD